MSPARQSTLWLGQARRSWGALAQAAVWAAAVIGSFLLPPPVGVSNEGGKVWLRLAQFVIAVLLGLLFVAARRWGQESHVKWWWALSAALLVLSVSSFIGYQYLSLSLTCKYDTQTVVVGTTYTQQGAYHVGQNPGIDCKTLLEDFPGKAEDIWTEASINRSRILLAGVYISTVPLFAVCMIGVIQAVSIVERNSGRRGRTRPRTG